jgi:hypothetical protein
MYPAVYSELYTEKMAGLQKKKSEKFTKPKNNGNDTEESYCGSVVDQYGEERSAKDIAMLHQFGCR